LVVFDDFGKKKMCFFGGGGGGEVERICIKIGCTHYNNRNEVFSYAFQASLKKLSTELHCTLGKE